MTYEQPQGWPRALKGLSSSLPAPSSVRQELACALRILARDGWQENVSGPRDVGQGAVRRLVHAEPDVLD